jgi:hypothetical protein
MWSTRIEGLANGRIISVDLENRPVKFLDVLYRWQDDSVFRAFFISLLADAPFPAFRWETPPITTATVDRPFEFALIDSPELLGEPDPDAFAEHFGDATPNQDVISFPNLSGDAVLVVPCPVGPLCAYGHIAAFVREAPEAQDYSLWRRVGEMMQRQLGPTPIWLNTAGAGVPWLHVRLDQRPKYYRHAKYRESSPSSRVQWNFFAEPQATHYSAAVHWSQLK